MDHPNLQVANYGKCGLRESYAEPTWRVFLVSTHH